MTDVHQNIEIGICSYSFHRLLESGKQDIFKYISECQVLGCTQLDPWNAHFVPLKQTDASITQETPLTPAELDYLDQIENAADESGLPWGTLTVHGAHIYELTADLRTGNRARAYRWLEIANRLGCEQVRIDAGGPEEMPDYAFNMIVEGYEDLIARAEPMGIEIITENHFGPTLIPANVEKLCTEIEGLGLLYDSHNWKEELRAEGRERCAKFATATHIKTFDFDAEGNEISGSNPEEAIAQLKNAGYKGVWGIESVPNDGDEIAGVKKAIALIQRAVAR